MAKTDRRATSDMRNGWSSWLLCTIEARIWIRATCTTIVLYLTDVSDLHRLDELVAVQLGDIVRQVGNAATERNGRAQLGHGHTGLQLLEERVRRHAGV